MRETSAPPVHISIMMCSSCRRGSSKVSKTRTMLGWSSIFCTAISCRSSAIECAAIPSSDTVFMANISPVARLVTEDTWPHAPRPRVVECVRS